jgi:hypothetical protein
MKEIRQIKSLELNSNASHNSSQMSCNPVRMKTYIASIKQYVKFKLEDATLTQEDVRV